ncbi:hypothetical protein E4J66_12870 [Actinomyces viscosus]|uniref:Uncharacterized protein n=1 Tax=Actinomyces viscosus TaxID=1656 RepID=A0A3S4VZB2_ACTVI|nr:hypothetical protein [Actinomyces viscosus]TFH51223.1 hypothetical protein E4J66_12870 [Actinomyces viscosus]VEI18718.1 Uncharacterised protein [Actinomyces viscosus]
MARLDTGGYTPVLILGDAEWLSVRAVAMGGRIPRDRVARRLRRSGILDDQGITPSVAPALHGVTGATRHLDVARFEPTRPGQRAEAWIGPQRATIVKHEPDGYHIYGLDECEVASAFVELLDVRPRPNIDLGPRVLPQQVYSIIDSGELDALTSELAGLARRLDRGGEPGQLGGPTPLTDGFASGQWTLSLISTSVPRDGGWEVVGSMTTLSVLECLYELIPRSVADALDSGAPPEVVTQKAEADMPEELVLEHMTSLELWVRVSPWFFAA